jgi:predicted MFS family arabinose efflux permease
MAFSPFFGFLGSNIGWRNTLRITSLVVLVVVSICAFFLKPRCALSETPIKYMQVIKDYRFLLLWSMLLFCSFGFLAPYFFLPTFAVYNGISKFNASIILGVMNGVSGIARIILGYQADKFGHCNLLLVCLVLSSLSVLLIWPFCTSFSSLLAFASIYGFFNGGFFSLLPTVIISFYGQENIGGTMGMIFTAFFPGDVFGTPVGGYLLDLMTTGQHVNFMPTILVSGSVLFFGSVLVFIIKLKAGNNRIFVKI